MDYTINPLPEMVSQKFWVGKMLGLPIIDPTCGRYCLKALLKYHIEVHRGVRLQDVSLPKPKSTQSDWWGYDPYDDFQYAPQMLSEDSALPKTAADWIALLQQRGPIILRGVLGNASVSHFILLVGANSDGAGQFHFKDPLVGDAVGHAPFATMQPKIDVPMVYGRRDIAGAIGKYGLQLGLQLIQDLPGRE